jgi:membrane protein DedA with SNARE-associated domain
VTRPVPLLAEAVAMMAGASRMRASTIAVGAAIGALSAAVLYAVVGALAVTFVNGKGFAPGALGVPRGDSLVVFALP